MHILNAKNNLASLKHKRKQTMKSRKDVYNGPSFSINKYVTLALVKGDGLKSIGRDVAERVEVRDAVGRERRISRLG